MTIAPFAAQAALRAFVASTGSDANTCTATSPCRSFAAALAVVDTGGEVVALDAAGYGKITITKSVTITSNPGFYAGITADTGTAVAVGGLVNVILRGLNIVGSGASVGIDVAGGPSIRIENCVISRFTTGILVQGSAAVEIADSTIRFNTTGVQASGGAWVDVARTQLGYNGTGLSVSADVDGTTTSATVSDSFVTGSSTGLQSSATSGTSGNAYLTITRSSIVSGGIGVYVYKGGGNQVVASISRSLVANQNVAFSGYLTSVESAGDNTVRNNVSNGSVTTFTSM